jgi:TonB family protein
MSRRMAQVLSLALHTLLVALCVRATAPTLRPAAVEVTFVTPLHPRTPQLGAGSASTLAPQTSTPHRRLRPRTRQRRSMTNHHAEPRAPVPSRPASMTASDVWTASFPASDSRGESIGAAGSDRAAPAATYESAAGAGSSDASASVGPTAESAATLTSPLGLARYYPRKALRELLEGRSIVEVVVRADGTVETARVIVSTPPGIFDESALRVARELRFEPARRAGAAVDSTTRIELVWRLGTAE